LALVIGCCTRELFGWHLSHSDRSKTAQVALEQALIARFGTLDASPVPFLLRSDNGLVFRSSLRDLVARQSGYRRPDQLIQ
jgi:putative transposase